MSLPPELDQVLDLQLLNLTQSPPLLEEAQRLLLPAEAQSSTLLALVPKPEPLPQSLAPAKVLRRVASTAVPG